MAVELESAMHLSAVSCLDRNLHFVLCVSLLCAAACGDDDNDDAEVAQGDAGLDAAPAADAGDSGTDAGDAAAASEGDAGAVAAVPPEVMAAAAQWPLPNRDYDNTRATFDSDIDSDNVDQLSERWRFRLQAAGVFGHVTASPLVLDGVVYIQDMSSNVFAVDLESGEEHWHYRSGLATIGPNGVAVGWGKVFAAGGDSEVFALDLDDGGRLWEFTPALVSSEGIDIQPLPYGGLVLMSTVPADFSGYQGGARGVIHALDQHDGRVRWSFDTIDSDDIWGDAEANGGGGAWYPPLVDPERGMTYWGTGNPSPWPGTASAPNGQSRPGDNLYTSCVVALSLSEGVLEWFHQEMPHDLFDWDFQNSPMRVRADGDAVMTDLVIGSGKTGTVVALEADSGELVWRARVGRHENADVSELPEAGLRVFPGALGGVLTATAYAEGVVYAAVVNLATAYTPAAYTPDLTGGTGELVALDVRSGEQLWSRELAQPAYGAATVVNDLVFTSDAGGTIHAFERESGDPVWQYAAPSGINAPISVAGNTLLVPVGLGGLEGWLLALSL